MWEAAQGRCEQHPLHIFASSALSQAESSPRRHQKLGENPVNQNKELERPGDEKTWRHSMFTHVHNVEECPSYLSLIPKSSMRRSPVFGLETLSFWKVRAQKWTTSFACILRKCVYLTSPMWRSNPVCRGLSLQTCRSLKT